MRLWSLSPNLLDFRGLVALWRETLLAKNVLLGNTKGYKNHPQLIRFKNSPNPLNSIDFYLKTIFEAAQDRSYNFDKTKFNLLEQTPDRIKVTQGQMDFEMSHLVKKLQVRDQKWLKSVEKMQISTNPLFEIVPGEVESWEKLELFIPKIS